MASGWHCGARNTFTNNRGNGFLGQMVQVVRAYRRAKASVKGQSMAGTAILHHKIFKISQTTRLIRLLTRHWCRRRKKQHQKHRYDGRLPPYLTPFGTAQSSVSPMDL